MTEAADTLVVEHLSKRYILGGKPRRELWALRDVSFTTGPGTVLGIIGANGAGKSTLLKVLSRVTRPTEGRAAVRGRVVSLLELGGVVQGDLSGVENVYLNGALYGIPRSEIVGRLDEIFAFAELDEFRDTPVKRYSSGMYLRLAFSVAVHMDPDILLADEVLAVGDVSFQERCLQRVAQAGADGLTVLFVSHDMAAVRRLCTQVMWLDAGRVVSHGSADDVINDYEEYALARLAADRPQNAGHGASGRILGVHLRRADGSETAAAQTTDDLEIVVSFAVDRPAGSARCAIGVDSDGVPVFRSVQPDPLPADAGTYHVAVQIPRDLLADRLYSVKASVTLDGDRGRETLVLHNAMTFRIYEAPGESADDIFRGRMPGLVRPRLNWRRVTESDLVSTAPVETP